MKMNRIIKTVTAIALGTAMLGLTAFSTAAGDVHNTFEVVGTVEEAETQQENTGLQVPDRYNIVLFGLSFPDEADKDRSDSIILCTIDNVNKQLKFTSILRDTKADIEGHESQKINAAHRFGGPEFALDTINENFGSEK